MSPVYRLIILPALAAALHWPVAVRAQPGTEPYSQADYLAIIEAYVAKVENIYDGEHAYSHRNVDRLEDETLTWRRDPSRPFLESDRLIAVNGAPPSADRLARQERRMQRRLDRRRKAAMEDSIEAEERAKEGQEKERFLALLIPDSLTLVKQEGDLHYVQFRGMEEDRRNIYEHLVGTLVLDTRNEYIRELQVRVTEPFSTHLVMRINSAYFSLRFNLVDGRPVQTDATWQLDGSILFLKSLAWDEEFEWFDIERVEPFEES